MKNLFSQQKEAYLITVWSVVKRSSLINNLQELHYIRMMISDLGGSHHTMISDLGGTHVFEFVWVCAQMSAGVKNPHSSDVLISPFAPSHLMQNSEISAAADKLAECQETITILSKQLQALKSVSNLGPQDTSVYNLRTSSVGYKPQSLASIIAEEATAATNEGPMSSSAPRRSVAHCSKEKHGDTGATPPWRSMVQEENPCADALNAGDAQKSGRGEGEVGTDPKKRVGQSLLDFFAGTSTRSG